MLLRERPQARALHQPVTLPKVSQALSALQEVSPEVSPEVSLVEDSSLVSSRPPVQARQDSKWGCRDSKWVSQASTPDSLQNLTKPASQASRASNPRFLVSSLSREVFLGSRVSRVAFQDSRLSLEASLGSRDSSLSMGSRDSSLSMGSRDSSLSMGNLGQVEASTHHKVGLVVLELEQGQPQVQDMVLALLGLKDFSRKLR